MAVGIRELPPSFYADLAKDYQGKQDQFCQALTQAGLTPCIPQGAYDVLTEVSHLPGSTSKERAMHLLQKTGIARVPGVAFF